MKPAAPVRVVVDTSLIVSGLILPQGRPYEVVQAIGRGTFQVLLSNALYAEYRNVLNRPKFAQKYGLTVTWIEDFLFLVRTIGVQVQPTASLPVHVRDPKDDMVLAAALGGAADFIVTGDRDLLVLDGAPELGTLRIVTARALLAALASHEAGSG